MNFPDFCRRIVETTTFQFFILGVIVCAGILVGVETYPSLAERYEGLIHFLDKLILGIFILEIVLKMGQHGWKIWRYFYDSWNVFDFIIVAVCLLPIGGSFAAVLRLARIVRALRLVTALPQLQLIVGALLKSIPSMGYVGILLGLNFYVYAIVGVSFFRDNDPIHFADLQTAMLSLFRVVTLEDWTDVMYINMFGSDHYPGPDLASYQNSNNTGLTPKPHAHGWISMLYFVSFVMFGTMIMLNLFIGVILSSMDEAQAERERDELRERKESGQALTIDQEFDAINHQIETLTHSLELLKIRMSTRTKTDSSL